MPNIPIITHRTEALGPQRQAQMSGSGAEGQGLAIAGQGLTQVAEALHAEEVRKQTRSDAIGRVRAINDYKARAQEEFTLIESEGDLTDPETVRGYHQRLRDLAQEVVTGHRGTADSTAELTMRIEEVRGQWTRDSYRAGSKAQEQMMTLHKDSRLNEISNTVVNGASSPDVILSALTDWHKEIDALSSALPQGVEDSWRRQGESVILKSAIAANIDQQDYSAAKVILGNPQASAALDPDTLLHFKTQIAKGEYQQSKGVTDGNNAILKAETILGRPLRPEERARVAGVATSQGDLAGRVSQLETILGRPATEAEITKMAGAHIDSGDDASFGKGLRGRAIAHMIKLAPVIANGMATDEQRNVFMSSVMEYTTLKDPDTGLVVPGKVPLPEYASEAMARAGLSLPGVDLNATYDPGATPLDVPPDPGKSIWDRAELVTGPVPAAAEFARGIPGVGGMLDIGEFTQARNFVPILQRELVRVLQNNPRYAEGERRAIEKEVSIEPRVLDNPSAYRDRLVAIDEALAVREQVAFNTARNPNVGAAERIQARNILNGIIGFRQQLGVPPAVTTEAEYKSLPDGAAFRWNGQLLRKGGDQSTGKIERGTPNG